MAIGHVLLLPEANWKPIHLSEAKMKAKGTLKEYRVIGRKMPTESEPVTPLYRYKSKNYEHGMSTRWLAQPLVDADAFVHCWCSIVQTSVRAFIMNTVLIYVLTGWGSLPLTRSWPSPASGTSLGSWGSSRRPLERLSLWRRSVRRSLSRSRILVSGFVMIPGPYWIKLFWVPNFEWWPINVRYDKIYDSYFLWFIVVRLYGFDSDYETFLCMRHYIEVCPFTGLEPTTCTASTGTWLWAQPSPSATGTWEPGTGLELMLSRWISPFQQFAKSWS